MDKMLLTILIFPYTVICKVNVSPVLSVCCDTSCNNVVNTFLFFKFQLDYNLLSQKIIYIFIDFR